MESADPFADNRGNKNRPILLINITYLTVCSIVANVREHADFGLSIIRKGLKLMSNAPAATSEIDELRHLALECHELAAHHHLTPFAQGKLDCLCGLYSIINALRLMRQPIAPISEVASRRLFEAGIASLLRKGLLDAALVDGMVIRHWKQLAALLARQASTNAFNVTVETPAKSSEKLSADSIERWMVESLAAGMPVLMHLGQRHQHYTVVAGIDRQHISLFDSWRLVRIKRAGFVLRQDITANCLMRLNLLHCIQR